MPFSQFAKFQVAHVEYSLLRRGMEPPKKGDTIERSPFRYRVTAVVVRQPQEREIKTLKWGWELGDRMMLLELTRVDDDPT